MMLYRKSSTLVTVLTYPDSTINTKRGNSYALGRWMTDDDNNSLIFSITWFETSDTNSTVHNT